MPPWCGYEEYRALGSQRQMDSVAVFKPFYTKKHPEINVRLRGSK